MTDKEIKRVVDEVLEVAKELKKIDKQTENQQKINFAHFLRGFGSCFLLAECANGYNNCDMGGYGDFIVGRLESGLNLLEDVYETEKSPKSAYVKLFNKFGVMMREKGNLKEWERLLLGGSKDE